jgi:hypothetical protein
MATANLTKIDTRAQLRRLYRAPSDKPVLLDVPERPYLMLDGFGPPGGAEFSAAVGALFAVAWSLRAALKSEGVEGSVGPLEALWSAPSTKTFAGAGRHWTLMIGQPDEVTPERLEEGARSAYSRKPLRAIARVRLGCLDEGLCVQITHVGPYANEGETIERLAAFAARQGFELVGQHHEIYLSDPRRTPPERLRTIVRYQLAPANEAP